MEIAAVSDDGETISQHAHRQSGHGSDPAAQDLHSRMAAVIADCQVLPARGMGAGHCQSLQQAGHRPIVTDLAGSDEAALAVASGEITDHVERLH